MVLVACHVACFDAQSVAGGQPAPTVNLLDGARIRLANALMREAYVSVSPTDLTPVELDAAIYLSRKSAMLQPEDSDRWRMMFALASLVGDISPTAFVASQEALARLVKLCPADQVVRLRRILQDVERRETAQDRVEAFKKFLTPEAIKVIETPVAARLAFDLALFESRLGDVDAFGNYLSQSLTLSPAFPAAAETAAGFINERIDDPIGECELLTTAALANPIETRSWTRLGALLLQERAYGSAARVYQIAIQTMRFKDDSDAVLDVLICDYALSLWGAGRLDDAIQALAQYIHDAKERQSIQIQAFNPHLSKADCEAVSFVLPPLVAMLDAAIRVEAKNSDATKSIADLVVAAKAQAKTSGSTAPSDVSEQEALASAQDAAQVLLDAATIAALMDAESETVQGLVDSADIKVPLTDDAKERFGAYKKLKEGDAIGALTILDKVPSTQLATRLVRARALAMTGERKAAARIYLDVALGSPGTLLGLFANGQLKELLATGIPPSEWIGKLDGIVASIPSLMEQYVSGTKAPVSFQVVPERESVEPFDPIRYRLTIRNDAILPLAVATSGPIKEHVLLQPRISSSINPGIDRLMPQIIPFDRAIELSPGESMSMTWDVGYTEVSLRLNQDPIAGGVVEMRGASNYAASSGAFFAGTFGTQPAVKQVQVNGVRVTPEWISSAITVVAAPTTDRDLVDLVLLAFAAKKKLLPPETEVIAWKAIADGYAKLPPEAQAWVLFVGPHGTPEFESVLDIARATTSGDVRGCYLLTYCTSRDDAQLAAALRSEDEFARLTVEVMAARFQREAVRADERMRGEGAGASAGAVEKLKLDLKDRPKRKETP